MPDRWIAPSFFVALRWHRSAIDQAAEEASQGQALRPSMQDMIQHSVTPRSAAAPALAVAFTVILSSRLWMDEGATRGPEFRTNWMDQWTHQPVIWMQGGGCDAAAAAAAAATQSCILPDVEEKSPDCDSWPDKFPFWAKIHWMGNYIFTIEAFCSCWKETQLILLVLVPYIRNLSQ